MAVDTQNKRASAFLDGGLFPNPDATIDAGDRLHMLLYRGIAAGAPAAVVSTPGVQDGIGSAFAVDSMGLHLRNLRITTEQRRWRSSVRSTIRRGDQQISANNRQAAQLESRIMRAVEVRLRKMGAK